MEEKQLTRKEQYLTAIAEGDTSKMPEKPLTREEGLLEKIAKKPSTAVDPADITNAVNNYFEEHPSSIEPMTKSEMLDILRGGE